MSLPGLSVSFAFTSSIDYVETTLFKQGRENHLCYTRQIFLGSPQTHLQPES